MRPDRRAAVRLAKRLQGRFHAADYAEAALNRRWSRPATEAPYEERVYRVAPAAAEVSTLLVFKPDEIGDAVYALPAVAELKRAFPHARIHLVCQRLTQALYDRTGLFDEIVTVTPSSRWGRPSFDVARALEGFSVRSFDMSVYLRTYSASFRQFTAVPARVRVHPVDPLMRSDSVYRAHVSLWDQPRRHQSLQMLEIVGRVTGRSYGFEDVVFPPLNWSDDDRRATGLVFGDTDPGPFIVVHPFAKHETRQYPLPYWSEVINRLRDRVDARWVVVGGPDDPRIDAVPGVLQTQGTLTLPQTLYLMSRAAAFIGVLSGPAHWSGALGTSTATIMSGHSLPIEWAPLGRSVILRAPVPCAPCHQPTCPIYDLACLRELRPERIEPELADFLAGALADGGPTSRGATVLDVDTDAAAS